MKKNNIISLIEKLPHTSGVAICMECKYEWEALTPNSFEYTDFLECPECGLHKGRFKYPLEYSDYEHWQCSCENTIFHITQEFFYCPNCGVRTYFGDL